MAVQSATPHELLGFNKDSTEGILLSMAIVAEVHKTQQAYSGSNKQKQGERRGRMHRKAGHRPRRH